MIISEEKIRLLLREKLKNKGDYNVKTTSNNSNNTDKSSAYEGELVTASGGKKYLGDPRTGISPKGYWDGFRKKLEAYVNSVYPEIGLKIDNLGVTRALSAAADNAGNKDRVSGSKHGAGLAQDVYMHTKKYGKYTSYKKFNSILVKDQKLVDAIISFLELPEYKNKVYWGGAFSSGKASLKKGQTPKGRGITEFHHFEFANKDMPKYFKNFENELKKVGMSSNRITSTKALAKLYQKLI